MWIMEIFVYDKLNKQMNWSPIKHSAPDAKPYEYATREEAMDMVKKLYGHALALEHMRARQIIA